MWNRSDNTLFNHQTDYIIKEVHATFAMQWDTHTQMHWNTIKRIFKYFKKTIEYGTRDTASLREISLDLDGYSDTDYVNDAV